MRALAATAVLVPLALAGPASAGYPTDRLVEAGSASASAGSPAPAGHALEARCDMIRTNSTLVKFWGGAAAAGHAGVSRTRIACTVQAYSPSQGSTSFTVTGDEALPSASAGGSAGVPADAVVSVCIGHASVEWTDGHAAAVVPTC